MPPRNLEVDDSDSDHDYDEVFVSDDEEDKEVSKKTRSKSLDEEDIQNGLSSSKIELSTSPNSGTKSPNLFNYKLAQTKSSLVNFLKKQREKLPSLESASQGDAVLVRVSSLPDSDYPIDKTPLPRKLEERRSTEPELVFRKTDQQKVVESKVSREPLLTKRKFLISKSLNNSPKLPIKNRNNEYVKYSTLQKGYTDNVYENGRDVIRDKCDVNGSLQRPFVNVKLGNENDFNRKNRINYQKQIFENSPKNNGLKGSCNSNTKINNYSNDDYVSIEESKDVCSKDCIDCLRGLSEDVSIYGMPFQEYDESQCQKNEGGAYIRDAETQTHGTPPLSRSSSCTWNSECSSSVFNTGSTNASASEDDAAAVDDDIRSSSSSGADANAGSGHGGEESGIGTASPPPRMRKEPDEGTRKINKCKRKETWERLRMRQSHVIRRVTQCYRSSTGNDVWVRRESVMTQTNSPETELTSDNTCNTEETSSNENLLLNESLNEYSSENSLRRNILSKKYNEMNQSSSGVSVNNCDELDDSFSVNSSASSLLKPKYPKPVRPSYLHLKIVNVSSVVPSESPNSSSADCLEESRSFGSFLGQVQKLEPASPSSASLKLNVESVVPDLGGKCVSVPSLLRRNQPGYGKIRGGAFHDSEEQVPQKLRAQSERHIAEIEAAEACKWLRAAGFPQYAQMYEDMQFPINVSGVQSDHPFLDPDSLQSLFRRLAALNRCADMKVEHQHHPPKHTNEDSDEENQCALSENWQYERKSRRWSRVVDITPQAQQRLQAIADRALAEQSARERANNPEGVVPDLLTVPGQEVECQEALRAAGMGAGAGGDDQQGSKFRRSGSERLRDGAKAFLRRVESIKSRRRRRQNRDGVVISSPQVFDELSMQQKMKDLNCIDLSPTANVNFMDFSGSPTNFPVSPLRSHPPSPLSTMPPSPMTSTAPSFAGQVKLSPTPFGDDSSSYCSDGSQGSGNRGFGKAKLGSRAKKFLHRNIRTDDAGAMSDSECQPSSWRHHYFKDANSNNTKLVLVEPPSPPEACSEGAGGGSSPPASPPPVPRSRSRSPAHRAAARAGSLNLKSSESQRYKDRSFKRDKSASRSELSGSQESQQSHEESEDKVTIEVTPRTKSGNVQRWHSFQRSSSLGSRPTSSLVVPPPVVQHEEEEMEIRPMAAMSCGQLQVLRKLALLKLTACMERYCPTHRTGWNWELPKFIRKIKAPDYKDKTVFGVPLLVSLQRTGHALPKPIQTALRWLRNNALDQVGIFRKAGVRSRTLRLRQLAEGSGVGGTSPPPPPAALAPYDEQQAHDVADMVKQYFRELPDALLTNKLSETFIAIFQHVPPPMREDAVQCALLLLPEEHREALQVVLAFLQQVADHSATNQMTASNLAVCLAPTLLRLHHHPQGQGNSNKEGNSNRSASASPRRRRPGAAGTGAPTAPDARELNESRAAHDCLLLLIKRHRELFTVSADTLQRCKFNSLEESVPVTMEELGSEFQQDWKGFQEASTQALLKEAREKSRGWVSVSTHEPHVELCYRKVGDGHPLRLWRVTTEVEAPPSEVLNRILRERHIWDDSLLKWRVVERLSSQAEVFQYLTASMAPLQAKDYCVLRSWQSDLPRGGCCVVETSVTHAGAPVLLGGVRAVVLASRYLIEPAGKGRSRLMHLARVDTKGRTPEWYNKSYGHLCALYSARIRQSFKHNTDGPESNV